MPTDCNATTTPLRPRCHHSDQRTVIRPPATLGILGGGQLGRYFVMAARTMGYRTIVLEPDPHAPAGRVADEHLVAAYDDQVALQHLAATCAVVTTEFENPPSAAMDWLSTPHDCPSVARRRRHRAGPRTEKAFLRDAGIPVAPFAVSRPTQTSPPRSTVHYPAILKTARMGYDGKGQVGVASHDDLADAWAQLGRQPCVLEQRLTARRRGLGGARPQRRRRGRDLSHRATTHTSMGSSIARSCRSPHHRPTSSPRSVAKALDYVGVLAVEMFVVGDQLLVNELAPRPHNSGHWTLDAARTSQFEQQVRAVCGVGLGDPSLSAPAAAMVNLLGDLWADGEPDWSVVIGRPAASLHLYGKTSAQARPQDGPHHGHRGRSRSKPNAGQGDQIWTDDSVVCADHDRRNRLRLHHGPHRLARPRSPATGGSCW